VVIILKAVIPDKSSRDLFNPHSSLQCNERECRPGTVDSSPWDGEPSAAQP